MNEPATADTQVRLEVLAQQILTHFAHGATLGSMLEIDDRECELMYTLGHALYMQHRFSDAAKVFGFLVTHNHMERRYTEAYASSLHMCGDYPNAIRLYTIASIMDMSDPTPCFHTCECLAALGLLTEAAEGLAMVVRQCRDDSRTALRSRAEAMLDLLVGQAGNNSSKDAA